MYRVAGRVPATASIPPLVALSEMILKRPKQPDSGVPDGLSTEMWHVKHFAHCSPKSHKALCLAECRHAAGAVVSSYQVARFRGYQERKIHSMKTQGDGKGRAGGINTAAKSVDSATPATGRANPPAKSVDLGESTITLDRRPTWWHATYAGSKARKYQLGTQFTVQTGFASDTEAQDVVIGMSALNWGYTVSCDGCQSYRDNEPVTPTSSLAISTPAYFCPVCEDGYKALPNGLCTAPTCPFSIAGGAR